MEAPNRRRVNWFTNTCVISTYLNSLLWAAETICAAVASDYAGLDLLMKCYYIVLSSMSVLSIGSTVYAGQLLKIPIIRTLLWAAIDTILRAGQIAIIVLLIKRAPEIGTCSNPEKSQLIEHIVKITGNDSYHASRVCRDLMSAWVVAIFPLFLGFMLNLLAIMCATRKAREKFCMDRDQDVDPDSTYGIWICLSVILIRLILGPVRFAYRCTIRFCSVVIPPLVKSPLLLWRGPIWAIRGIRRIYLSQRLKRMDEEKAIELGQKPEWMNRKVPGSSAFENLVAIDDVFFALCEHLHGGDLRTLGSVSKATNAMVKRHWSHDAIALRKRLCYGINSSCFYCNTPICSKCFMGASYGSRKTLSDIQLKTLQPVCTWCYFLELCYAWNLFESMTKKCYGEEHADVLSGSGQIHSCEFCASFLLQQKVERPKGETEHEASLRLRETALKAKGKMYAHDTRICCACERQIWVLPMRWWRCSVCRLECGRRV